MASTLHTLQESSQAVASADHGVPVDYVSFDGGVRISTARLQPDRYRTLESSQRGPAPVISRGAGRSYAAASFSSSAITIEHPHFNRLLDFDAATQTIEVEAGTPLGKLYEFLTPRGFFVSVQPGHPKISVGGCIASDVHGKNQYRDGTFSSLVVSLKLLHPSYGTLELSQENEPELLALTCGGYGLTGSIVSARLKVTPIESASVQLRVTNVDSIYHLPDALREAASRSDLVYSWHQFTSLRGKNFGRGSIIEGSFAPPAASSAPQKGQSLASTKSSLDSATRGRRLPGFFNSLTTAPFNRLYAGMSQLGGKEKIIPLYDFLFPVHDKELYFHLFGKGGFHEYQIIIPFSRYQEFMSMLQQRLETHPFPITLASGKLFQGEQKLLRFTGEGICFSFNFPRSSSSLQFAEFLDKLAVQCAAQPNLIKDSRLPAAVVSATYPEYERFRKLLRAFDPNRSFRSELSDRLQL